MENYLDNQIYIYSTDTVWGIGASIYSENAQMKIISIKKMDKNKPTSILFSDLKMIREYFSFPVSMSDRFFEDFFSLESTLAITKDICKKEVPKWITATSPLIAIRYLRFSPIREITQRAGSPITTTSLNITKEPPIITEKEARDFRDNYAPEAMLLNDDDCKLSGQPSSILSYDTDGKIEFLRKGRFADEIEKHIKLLST